MPDPAAPRRRDLHFPLDPARLHDWHPAGVHASIFLNTLSVFFPDGERFFIRSVRNLQHHATDPALRTAVGAFAGQEAMHGREHDDYNALSRAAGLPVAAQARWSARMLRHAQRFLSPLNQLAITIALEHLTAILADSLLRRPDLLDGADPHYRALWTWHALEETEHKAVAFDVYTAAAGRGPGAWLRRCAWFLLVSFEFSLFQYGFWIRNVFAAGHGRDLRGWARVLNWLWGGPGVLRRVLPDWLRYLKPGFHPWDLDNRHYLPQLASLEARYAAQGPGTAAAGPGPASAAA